jgi:SAM-dependent methyltransferase
MPTPIEQWDQRYLAGEQVFRTPAPLVVEFTRGLTPGIALDLASGPGRNSLYLAARGWQVTAVDGSSIAIDLLRRSNPSIDAHLADLEADFAIDEFIMAPETYDLILCCYYFQRSLIPRIKSALRPGGLLIMIVHVTSTDEPRETPRRACPGELRALFSDWTVLHYREGEPGESCHRHAVAELVAKAHRTGRASI